MHDPKQRPIRILHLITGLGVGGAETMLFKLLSAMDRDRFENVVYSMIACGSMAERFSALGVEVGSLGMGRGMADPLAVWRFARILRSHKPDLLQTWMYHADLLGGVASRIGRRTPLVWNLRHGLSNGDKRRTLQVARLCAQLSTWLPSRIVCCAESTRLAHCRMGYAANKMVVIPNGFDLGQFQPQPDAATACERRLGIPAGCEVILHAARYHPQKDHKGLLQAARMLIDRCPKAQLLFVLCGDGVTDANAELSATIDQLQLRDHVRTLGRIEPREIALLMARSLLTTSASQAEGFPNVIGEAMACGTIVVATDAGDSAFIVGDAGIMIAPGSPHALAEAWFYVLSLSPQQRREAGRAARARVMRNFSLPAVAARYQELYSELADGGRCRSGHSEPAPGRNLRPGVDHCN